MSWKPEVLVGGKWCQNALVFATREEALRSAEELRARWWVPDDHRVVESDQPVNYRYVGGNLERVEP